jgi:hypothetical protein
MANEKTITVARIIGNGTKQITREEYRRTWSNHFSDLYKLTDTTDDYETVKTIIEGLNVLVDRSFDNVYKMQNNT